MIKKRPVSTSEAIARQAEFERRAVKIQMEIMRIVVPTGVKVSFGEGRRSTDVAMVLLKGDRVSVLQLPTKIEDRLEQHIHIVRSSYVGRNFELLVAVMEPLDRQPLRNPERRAALQRQLERFEQVVAEDAGLLEMDLKADGEGDEPTG